MKKLIPKHQKGGINSPKIINEIVSKYQIKSDNLSVKTPNVKTLEQLQRENLFREKQAMLKQKGTLTDLKGTPDNDTRSSSERNKDYLNSTFNKEKFDRGLDNFVKGIKPYAGAAATAFGATTIVPALGGWGTAGATALKGGTTGVGLGLLGAGTGDIKTDFLSGALMEGAPTIINNIKLPKYSDMPWVWKPDPNKYYRVVGTDAISDLNKTNLVRSAAQVENKIKTSGINLGNRPTAFPSFSKGSPSMEYARNLPNHNIIETARNMKASTLGRHGVGTTQFPVDEFGNYLKQFPASEVDVLEPHWFYGYKKIKK